MTTTYRILINVQPAPADLAPHGYGPGSGKHHGYQPGDALVQTWEGTFDESADTERGWSVYLDGQTTTGDARRMAALDGIFARHNRDDRPDGQRGPSLSVGDVIWLDQNGRGQFWAVESVGFRPVTGDEIGPIETRRTWRWVMQNAENAWVTP